RALDDETLEGWLAGVEAASEATDEVGLARAEDVHHERVAAADPASHVAAALDRQRDLRRLERALLHPARQHTRFLLAVPGRHDEQAARNAAQRGRPERLFRVGVHLLLTPTRAPKDPVGAGKELSVSRNATEGVPYSV